MGRRGPMQRPPDGYLWPLEYARAHQVSDQSVYQWMEDGRLPYVEVLLKGGRKPHRAIPHRARVIPLPQAKAPPGTVALKTYAQQVGREPGAVWRSCVRGMIRYRTTFGPVGKGKRLYWIYIDQ